MGDSVGMAEDAEEINGQRAQEMIEYIESQIERGKRLGARFDEMESVLQGAKMMIATENYLDAMELINQCSQDAGRRLMDFERLMNAIKKAEKEIESAEGDGKDIEEAARLLKLAKFYKKEGNYKIGLTNANKSVEALAEKNDAEIAWGSGL